MTINEAHVFLGINKTQTLQEIASRYLDYIKVNPNVEYIEWLEQEVIIQSICDKLSLTPNQLFKKLNITREELISQYIETCNIKSKERAII